MDEKIQIKSYLMSISYFKSRDETILTYDFPLMENDIITSIEVINLVEFLEENFKITVTVSDVVEENFGSINKLYSFVKAKVKNI